MLKALLIPLKLSLFAFACLFTNSVSAQVTSDGTVNTQVNQNEGVAEITGGETRGDNLFHSFQDFSVPTGNEAFFDNADSISNIFSRVTGGNISNIDGAIRANGSASLFLINPAGIIFGENASLDIGGSFYGSSASSILFEDGSFSAVDNLDQPILTVNAPVGLGFRDEPGDIVNRSRVESGSGEILGLEVNSGNNLALVGGNLNFEAGQATARGGNIYLGGLAEAGIVDINENGSLNFPEDIALANITLTNGADVDTRGAGGGDITVNARNLTLEAGEFGSSFIGGGIKAESTNPEAQAGNISINVAENIRLNESQILNLVDAGGMGNAGNITINTGSVELISGSFINASTLGQGNAGAVDVTATGDITIDGEDSQGSPRTSSIGSLVNRDAEGDSGGVTISATNLNLTNGGQVNVSTLGQGNAGAVDVTATGDITIDGSDSDGFPSSITSQMSSEAKGDSGGVTISATNLNLTNGGQVDASTLGQGNAGAVNVTARGDMTIDGEGSRGFSSGIISGVNRDAEGDSGGVTISATNLNLTNGGLVNVSTLGLGNAGAVNVTATGDIAIDGENSRGFSSGITSGVNPDAEGDSGGVTISTNNLNLTNGGRVSASTEGRGNAGAVNITATGDLTADGEDLGGDPSGIESEVSSVISGAEGDSGGVTISTNNLNLTNGGRVAANTGGRGNAGAVKITATGDLTADGEDSNGIPSNIASQVSSGAEGDSAGVTISTNNLNLTNGGSVDASTLGRGNAGAVDITVTGDLTADGEALNGIPSGIASQVNPGAEGDSGGVTISTNNLNLTSGGRVAASALGRGNAGAVDITVTGDLTADGEDSDGISSGITSDVNPGAEGDSGGVTISTNNLNLTNGGEVSASTGGLGNAGAVDITATGDLAADGENSNGFSSGITSLVNTNAEGNSGGVTVSTTNLNLTNGGRVSASTLGQGNAGAVNIDASKSIFIDGSIARFRSGISANAINRDGNGGDISINTGNLSIANGGTIGATNFDTTELVTSPGTGQPGNITIAADSIALTDNARIETATQFAGEESGVINLNIAEDITLSNNSFISAEARNEGNGGNLNIDTNFIIAFLDGNNDIVASAEQGNGGNININADSLFGIEERPLNDATNDINASSEFSLDGNVNVSTLDVDPVQGVTELSTNIVVPEETTQQACASNRESAAKNGLDITGKGGVVPDPTLPLSSLNVTSNEKTNSVSAIPQPIETSQGAIQPARGIKVAKSGEIILTAYRTNNAGERLPEIKPNCNRI